MLVVVLRLFMDNVGGRELVDRTIEDSALDRKELEADEDSV